MKTDAVDLLAAAGPVAEADDVGAVLPQSGVEGEAFGVVGEGDEPGLAIVDNHPSGWRACRRA